MKNKMPLDGLGLGHDSGSVHCDMLKMLCFRTAWGGHNNIREIWDGTVKSQPFVFVYVDMLYVILYVNYTCSGCKGNN